MYIMKVSFVLNCGVLNKREVFCLENATMFQIQDMFENGKPCLENGQKI